MKKFLYEIRYYIAAVTLVLWLVPDTNDHPSGPVANAAIKPVVIIESSQNKNPQLAETESDKLMQAERRSATEVEIRKNDTTMDLLPQPNHY